MSRLLIEAAELIMALENQGDESDCFPDQGTKMESPSMSEIRRFIVHPFLPILSIAILSLLLLAPVAIAQQYDPSLYSGLRWRMIGPFRAGRVNAVSGVVGQPDTFYFGSVGGGVWKSSNAGRTWAPVFDSASSASIGAIGVAPSNPGTVYVGTGEPDMRDSIQFGDGMYKSTDAGRTWSHAGLRQTKFIGRICVHPTNPDLVYVAALGDVFGANRERGVFRSKDGGKSWEVANKGTRAEFLPEKYPEYGQCVHKLLLADSKSSLLFQQNHCGVYRSTDGGRNWQEVTAGLPSDFGFPLAIHPREPETIFVLPLKGAEFRCPPEGRLRVYRSRNGGKSWKALNKGLPQQDAFVGVYREGMAMDSQKPAGVYFGTNTGKLFGSADEGDSWSLLADNLPPVYSVSKAVV